MSSGFLIMSDQVIYHRTQQDDGHAVNHYRHSFHLLLRRSSGWYQRRRSHGSMCIKNCWNSSMRESSQVYCPVVPVACTSS